MRVFQDKLFELRKQNHYTQKQMAEMLSIKQPSYVRYENGTAEPTQEMLVKIAEIFDVSVDYLLGRKEL